MGSVLRRLPSSHSSTSSGSDPIISGYKCTNKKIDKYFGGFKKSSNRPLNRDLTEGRLLGFAMILALQCCPMFLGSALMRGIHPPEKIQNGERSGGECLSYICTA
jgi:hypothetical protein